MSDQTRAAQQLAAITENLLSLFTDYCQRASSPDLSNLIHEYKAQRINLVLTVHASMSGTDFICCAMPVGETSNMVQLFTVHTIPAAPAGKAH